MSASELPASSPGRARGVVVAAYGVIYLVWGSTYLAMRIAAESMPPFWLASVRFLLSAAALLAWALWQKQPLPQPRAWGRALLVGLFLLVLGNGSVVWAVQRVPSGVAAVLIAMTPVWLALLSRTALSRRLVVGLVCGTLGIGVLVGPQALGAGRIDFWGAVALIVASMSWALGSVIQRGGKGTSVVMSTGMQMLCGAGLLYVVSWLLGENVDVAHITWRSALALGYLTIGGSLVGFTTYAWLLVHEPPARVSTYAYVNPIVAVALGSVFAHEALTGRVLMASIIIISGVVVLMWPGRSAWSSPSSEKPS